MKLTSIILTAFLFSFISAFPQTERNCVATKVDLEEYKKMLQLENANTKTSPATPIVIRIFFRVCEPPGGSPTDITEDQINTDFKHLVGAYQGHNICFVNAGYDKLFNTALDTFNTNNDDYHIFLPYGIQNCITVFYIDKLGGTNNSSGGGFSGITYGVGTAWTIVAKGYVGTGTMEHEVGHCFGLLHTFDYRTSHIIENINGSNGTSAADFITDTHADPYAFAYEVPGANCFHATCTTSCIYDGTCQDLNNQTNYSPPYTNLMSYWASGKYPTYTLTAGQFSRVNTFLTNNAALLATQSPATVTDGPYTINSGYHMASAISTLTTSGSVVISGTTNALLGAGATVFLEPGFHALPSIGGRILVRHSFCDTTSNAYSITKNNVSAKQKTTRENTLQNQVNVFPNPATSSATVSFTLKQSAKNVMLQVYNFNAQQMLQINMGNLMPASYSRTLNLNNFPQGIYVVLLKYNNQVFKSTLVVGK